MKFNILLLAILLGGCSPIIVKQVELIVMTKGAGDVVYSKMYHFKNDCLKDSLQFHDGGYEVFCTGEGL